MEDEKKVKQTLSTLLYNIVSFIIIVAVMLLKVATIDGILNVNWGSFGVEAAVIFIAQYVLFIINYAIGKDKGMLTEDYIKAREKCMTACDLLAKDCDPEKVQAYCNYITALDQQNRRRRLLAGVCKYTDFEEKYQYMNKAQLKAIPRFISDETGIVTAEFAKKLQKRRLSAAERAELYLLDKHQIKQILRAQRIKPERMTSSELIFADTSVDSRKRVAERPKHAESKQKTRKLLNGLTFSLVFSCITVNAVISLSWGSVVDMLLALVPIIIGLATGRLQGYNNSKVAAVAYFNSVSAEATSAYKWITGQKT